MHVSPAPLPLLAWATDVHLNACDEKLVRHFCDEVRSSGASALLLSGDVAEAKSLVHWLEYLADHIGIPIHYVLGNHDYYLSSVAAVRKEIAELQVDDLHYLSTAEVIPLTPDIALVGHDGWGDARIGDVENFVMLSDYFAIGELSETLDVDALRKGNIHRGKLTSVLRDLGTDAAETLRPKLLEASRDFRTVLVVTHVPPFREACWHEGSISDGAWLPGFTCGAMGELLREVAEGYPEANFQVLCGHTHGEGKAEILPNLHIHTGRGDYGELHLGFVKVDGNGIHVELPRPIDALG